MEEKLHLFLASTTKKYRYVQIPLHVRDRYKQLATVVSEVPATPCWKHLPQVSVLNSNSSHAVDFTVLVTERSLWVVRFRFSDKERSISAQVVHLFRQNAFWITESLSIWTVTSLTCNVYKTYTKNQDCPIIIHPFTHSFIHSFTELSSLYRRLGPSNARLLHTSDNSE